LSWWFCFFVRILNEAGYNEVFVCYNESVLTTFVLIETAVLHMQRKGIARRWCTLVEEVTANFL